MLLVETTIEKEQRQLQEEFCRDGNYFAVPSSKIFHIQQLIDSIIYQVFPNNGKYNNGLTGENKLLLQKIRKFVLNTLQMTISLSSLREIFEIVKKEHDKINYYQNYFLQLEELLEFDGFDYNSNKKINHQSLEIMFQEDCQNYSSQVLSFDNDFNHQQQNSDFYAKMMEMSIKRKYCQKQLESHQLLEQKEEQIQVKNVEKYSSLLENKTHSSLKFDIVSNSHFTSLHDIFSTQHHQSFSSDTENEQLKKSNIQDMKNQLIFEKATDSTIYSPSWKKIQDEKKKMLSIALGKDIKKQKQQQQQLEKSEYLNNLSKIFKPKPSVLNQESFYRMNVREAKDDIKKSQIMKSSIIGTDYPCNNDNEKIYNFNVKTMKIQQKLKKYDPRHNKGEIKQLDCEKHNDDPMEPTKQNKQKGNGGILDSLFRFKKIKQQSKTKQEIKHA